MSYVLGFDHVQVAMPKGAEGPAREFYGGLLGLTELPKPASLAPRGGLWFSCGTAQLHLGVDEHFVPARKAHPGLRIHNYRELLSRLQRAGCAVAEDSSLPGVERAFVADPFGNRVELVHAE